MKKALCTIAPPNRWFRITFATQVILIVFTTAFLVNYYTTKNWHFSLRKEVSPEKTEKVHTDLEPLLIEFSSGQKTEENETGENSDGLETKITAQQLLASSSASSRVDERGLAASDADQTRHSTTTTTTTTTPEPNDEDLGGKALDATKQLGHKMTAGFDSIRRNSHDGSPVDTSEITAAYKKELREGLKNSEEFLPDSSHELRQTNGHLEAKEESEKQSDVSTSNDIAASASAATLKHSLTAATAAANKSTSIYNKSATSFKTTIPTNTRTILTSKPTVPAPIASFRSNRESTVDPTSTTALVSSTRIPTPTSSLDPSTTTAEAATVPPPNSPPETAMTSCGNNEEHHLEMVTYGGDALERTFLAAAPKFANLWKQVKPAMTNSQRETVNMLLKEFVKACALYDITDYFIFSGSLLGSFRHHGLQPWDDDIDILMKHSAKDKIHRSLKTYVDRSDDLRVVHYNGRLKFFHRKRGVSINLVPYKWPFVDISFYYDNKTHIWEQYTDGKQYNVVPKSLIFPLHPRPFEGIWMNSPKDAYAVLSTLYRNDRCITLTWLHAKEEAPPYPNAQFECEITVSVYPFVHRRAIQGCMEESLKINGRVLQTLLIEEPTYAVTEPYRLKLVQPQSRHLQAASRARQ